MTIEELKNRQSWTLSQKIDHSVGTIESFIAKTGKIPYVSFSGGKDSTVLLDIARRFVDKDIKGVFCNTGNEWPENIRFVRQTENVVIIRPHLRVKDVLNKYGFPLISKEQSQYIREAKHSKSQKVVEQRLFGKCGKISNRWQFLIRENFDISEKCCYCLKKRPFYKYERETGEVPLLGIMTEESKLRTGQYLHRGGCNSFSGRLASFPLSIWREIDIWEYIHRFNISYSPIYNVAGVHQTGCMFCGFGAHIENISRFETLLKLHPKAYECFMNYKNNDVTYREALRLVLSKVGKYLPDERPKTLFEE